MASPTQTILPTEKHSHTVIFLHGRDSIATEFSEEFFESQASDGRTLLTVFPTIKWVFPTSKTRTSARFNADMSQWFDIWSVEDPSEREDIQVDGIRESIAEILDLICNEASLITSERIILGGISQGCAVAILALFRGRIKLGGFLGLCSWLPFQSQIITLAALTEKNQVPDILSILNSCGNNSKPLADLSDISDLGVLTTPVFLSHSYDDDVVPFMNGRKLYETLAECGFSVVWKAYKDGGHWINEPQGIDDIVEFLHHTVLVGM